MHQSSKRKEILELYFNVVGLLSRVHHVELTQMLAKASG